MHELKRAAKFYSFWIAFLVLLFYLAGCESTKNLDKSSSKNESEIKIDSSAYFHEQINQLQRIIDEERLSKKTGITFNPSSRLPDFPTSGLDQVPDCPPCNNVIDVKPDGSIHASGSIKSFNMLEDHYRKQIAELIDEREREINLRVEAERKQKLAESKKTVVKETKIMSKWWMWFLAGALTVLGIWIYISWKIHKIKKIASIETYYKNIMQ